MFAIDLGTSFSAVGVMGGHETPELIPHRGQRKQFHTPSLVAIRGNEALVGHLAERYADEHDKTAVCRYVKAEMGNDVLVFQDSAGRAYRPEAISALIIRKLANDVLAAGMKINQALITIPAHFNDRQREATMNAGRLAGIDVAGLIEEPVAAAAFYADGRNDRTILVYDMGGGTLDVSLVQGVSDGLYVLSTEGSSGVGGRDLDGALRDMIVELYCDQSGVVLPDRFLPQVESFARECKERMLRHPQGLDRSFMLAGELLAVSIDDMLLAELFEPWFEASKLICETVLTDAGLTAADIDDVVLVGGSSLLPMIATHVAELTGVPVDRIIKKNQREAVAFGAAKMAASWSGSSCSSLRQQVTTNQLGIRVKDELGNTIFHPLIRKNTPVPALVSTALYCHVEGQDQMRLQVLQRKDEYSEEEILGECVVGPLRGMRLNDRIEVSLGYDVTGRVSVSAKDPKSGMVVEQEFVRDGDAYLHEQQSIIDQLSLLT